MANALLKAIMRRDSISKNEAIEQILDEFDACGCDAEECLYNLGFEPDYVFNLIDIVADN